MGLLDKTYLETDKAEAAKIQSEYCKQQGIPIKGNVTTEWLPVFEDEGKFYIPKEFTDAETISKIQLSKTSDKVKRLTLLNKLDETINPKK